MPISTIGSNSLNQTSDLTINGVTVGKGGGAVATNTAVGASALNATNTGGKCTAFGYQALLLTTGKENTAVGSDAGAAMTSGEGLAAFGWSAAKLNTADNVTAIGHNSLGSNTTGANNTACGNAALNANTTGAANVAVGRQALVANTTASNNTAVGYQAGYTNSTGANNTFLGYRAGYSTTSQLNTFVGYGAGVDVSTGSKNTIVGGFQGNQGSLDIRTSSNYIVLSDGDGNPRITVDNGGKTRIGHVSSTPDSQVSTRNTGRQAYFFTTSASNGQDVCNVGNANGGYSFNAFRFWNGDIDSGSVIGSIACTTSATAYNTSSDYRLKNTISLMTGALDKVTRLKPVTYKWNLDNSSGEGFIAHELAEVCPDAVTGEKDAVDANGKPAYQGIDTSFLVATLTAAIQELKTIVDAQAAEIAELKAKVA